MVEVDAEIAVVVALVAKGVLHFGDGAVGRGVEVVLAHRLRGVAIEADIVVVEHDLLPANTTRTKREALVLGIATFDLVAADEVREGALSRRTEWSLRSLGRLEEHIRATIVVELVG